MAAIGSTATLSCVEHLDTRRILFYGTRLLGYNRGGVIFPLYVLRGEHHGPAGVAGAGHEARIRVESCQSSQDWQLVTLPEWSRTRLDADHFSVVELDEL